MRLFVGIFFSSKDTAKLVAVTNNVKKRIINQNIQWITPKNYHVTLLFLGDISVSTTKDVKYQLDLIKFNDFSLNTTGILFLPNSYMPKIIALSLSDEKITMLKEQVCQLLNINTTHKSFIPHITIARIKKKIKILPQEFFEIPRIDIAISRIALVESQLLPTGVNYKIIKNIPL